MKSITLCIFASIALIGCGPVKTAGSSSPTGSLEEDTCYNPQPGHPTRTELLSWVDKVSDYAQEAEVTYGVPAAAIVAMSNIEGGYGWTQTALYANNPFGFKFTSTTAAEGRSYWSLDCQPAADENNKYIAFSDMRDAFLFVGKKLATLDRSYSSYKRVTDAYVQSRQRGDEVSVAVFDWISGIADEGYNYNPATYKVKIKNMSNNYVTPATARSSSYNTYVYSEVVMPKKGSFAPSTSAPETATASFVTPKQGATVSGDVPLALAVPSSTTSVIYYSRAVGATDWYKIATKSAPFNLDWVTAPYVPNGSYELRAEVYGVSSVPTVIGVTVNVVN